MSIKPGFTFYIKQKKNSKKQLKSARSLENISVTSSKVLKTLIITS